MSGPLRNATRRVALSSTFLSGTTLLGAAVFGLAGPTPASADQQFLKHGSLVISSTTFDNTQGPLASLQVNTPIPNPNTAARRRTPV